MSDTRHEAPDIRVPFGDGPAQDLSVILAEAVLRAYWQRSPDVFGTVLRTAMKNLWPVRKQAPNGP